MTDDPNARALRALEVFRQRVFPAFLRRLSQWKGLDPEQHQDVIDDLMQDLVVDTLADPETILALPESERHARWLREAQRSHYRLALRGQRSREADLPLDAIAQTSGPAVGIPSIEDLDGLAQNDRNLLTRVASSGLYLKNGRLSSTKTARLCRVSHRRLRELWLRTADLCGFDAEYEDYWRRRLGEALLQLAAARLLESGELQVFGPERRRPFEPDRMRRRLRRIRNALETRPIAADLRSILRRISPARNERSIEPSPGVLLADASDLLPDEPAVELWRFEAAILEGDLRTAGIALRAARNRGADRLRTDLARARLLECRHRRLAARRMLTQLAREFPRDPRPADSLQSLERASPAGKKFAASRSDPRAASHSQRSVSPSLSSSRSTNRRSAT